MLDILGIFQIIWVKQVLEIDHQWFIMFCTSQVTKLEEDMDTGINQAEELESITTTVEPLTSSAEGLVRRACEKDVSLISAFEASLFPIIQDILAKEGDHGDPIELKLTSVASTKLIYENKKQLLRSHKCWIVFSLFFPDENKKQLLRSYRGGCGVYCHFCPASQCWKKKDEDLVKEIKDPKEFLVKSLARLACTSPGRYPAIIQEYLDPTNQAALIQLFAKYNCSIV
ncbi:hypothetical protein IFM89_000788 [Coptis chinensis]|uniref:Exportin-2 C-terminal domain-containing protein n=1 Tax=Coptis chinensis TaxID=261450 RepID=A0A835ITE5_9MAGN|nr:hypothetical protein IFM89_000788 [Coptis chinensis]